MGIDRKGNSSSPEAATHPRAWPRADGERPSSVIAIWKPGAKDESASGGAGANIPNDRKDAGVH
jgi:hypothetical protein